MNQTKGPTIRILVTAASKHGATAEIAGVIAERLTAAGEVPASGGLNGRTRP